MVKSFCYAQDHSSAKFKLFRLITYSRLKARSKYKIQPNLYFEMRIGDKQNAGMRHSALDT